MSLTWDEQEEIRSLGPNERREIVDALLRAILQGDDVQRKAAADRLSSLCIFGIVSDVVPIEPLVTLLRGADRSLQELAEYALANTDGRAFPVLVQLLDDLDPSVRVGAASSIAHIGEPAAAAAQPLRRNLHDPVAAVRKRAAFALGLIRAADLQTVDALVAMARGDDGSERASALHALGNVSAFLDEALRERVQATALAACADADAEARWGSLFILSRLECSADVMLPAVAAALQDPASRVQSMALDCIKEMIGRIDLGPLLPRLIRIAADDAEGSWTAIEILGRAGPGASAAIPALRRLAAQSGNSALSAADALWRITQDATEVLPVLDRAFEDHGERVCDIVCGMGAAAAPLVPKILDALGDDSYYDLQWAAADALAAVANTDPVVIEALQRALRHPSPRVKGAAARALGNVGKAAVPALTAELAPPFADHAQFVADALSRIGPAAISASTALRKAHRDGNWSLRAWSAIALAHIASDPIGVKDLINLIEAQDDDGPIREAINAVAAIGAPAKAALPVLRRAKKHWDPEVVADAEKAICAINQRAH